MDFDGSPEAKVLTESASVNPRFVAPRVSRSSFSGSRTTRAPAEKWRLPSGEPGLPKALPILAAAELLSGNDAAFRAVEERALARNPKDASFYSKLSNIAVNNRLYREARDFAAKAVELDSRSYEGYGLLGLNQLRQGDIEGGRKSLERSFEGDPYNVWIKNTLDLMDTYPDYVTTKTSRFEIAIEGKESDLLSGYVERIAEEAYESLPSGTSFARRLDRIEVYPSHGTSRSGPRPSRLRALGCFRPVIAVDSPSAPQGSSIEPRRCGTARAHRHSRDRPQGAAVVLEVSVLEERRARRVERRCEPRVSRRLPARKSQIAELNNGFMRPTYPQQIGISYYGRFISSSSSAIRILAIRDMRPRTGRAFHRRRFRSV
jgi:hypothetical protein